LCSYSNNRCEFWVSLVEKAYMKVCGNVNVIKTYSLKHNLGGYSFPGSSSEIDLHTLTGWIPEMIDIEGKNFDSDREWKRMYNGYRFGDCLINISTGKMDESLAESIGLVPLHAYAGYLQKILKFTK
jgi:calpain-7